MDVPEELATLPQWVAWKLIDDRKVPISAETYRAAKSNDPSTWSTLERALICSQSDDSISGIGFVFAPEGGIFGIDLDACIGDGEVQQWAQEIVNTFGTYSEVSPSGKGIKLWGRGKLPTTTGKKKAVDAPQVTDKPPAIEAYDRGRYFTFTGEIMPGCPLAINDCQQQLDALLARFWPEPITTAIVPVKRTTNISPLAMSPEERAARYMEKVPPAVSGQAGHNATFRAACILVMGFGLAPDRAYAILAGWNATCSPPWSERDLWHKINDAAKRECNDPGWMLREGGRYVGPDVDLQCLLGTVPSVVDEPAPLAPPDAGAFPVDCFRVPGLIGDLIDYTLRTSMYRQPELALAAAIALVGTITGRKVECDQKTRTNVYVMGLCPPAGGKEHARIVNKEILTLANQAVADRMLGPESIGSSAGLIVAIENQPAILFQLDEIGRMIQTMQSATKATHLFNIGTMLLKLYSSSRTVFRGDAYADVKKVKTIYQPHACVYGTSVPGKFWDSLSTDNVTEGLVGRFMVFESSLGYVYPTTPEEADNSSIVERVRWWIDYVPPTKGNLGSTNFDPLVVRFTPDARARMKTHGTEIAERRMNEPIEHAALWSRSGEKASKLALIFACSRASLCEPQEVNLDDVNRAIRLSNYLTRVMIRKVFEHVSENEHEAKVKKVLRLIDGPLTMTQFTRRTQFLRDKKERFGILENLIDMGMVTTELIDTATKPTTILKRVS